MTGPLSEVPIGKKTKVSSLTGAPLLNRRLIEMGLTPGTAVAVERVAPLGDPLDLRVRGYRLSLRKSEAAGVQVDYE